MNRHTVRGSRRLAPAVAALFAALGPDAAHAQPKHLEDVRVSLPIESATLPNGMRVVVNEDHARPIVAIQLCYGVGSSDDPPGQSGLAEVVTEVLKAPSTRHLRATDRGALYAFLGVRALDARFDTGPLRSCVTTVAPAGALPLVLWLESDRIGFSADGLTDDAIASARDAVLVRHAGGPSPTLRADRAVRRAIFGSTGPLAPESDDRSALGAVDVSAVRARLAARYGASQASLVIAGDVDAQGTLAEVERAFGALPRRAAPAAVAVAPAPRGLAGEEHTSVAGADVPSELIGWGPTPAWFAHDDTVLDAVASVLGARLRTRLIHAEKLAKWANAGQRSTENGSYFVVAAGLLQEESRVAVRAIVDAEIERLGREGPTPDEVIDARADWTARVLGRLSKLASRTDMLLGALHATGDPRSLSPRVADCATMSAADIKAATLRYLPRDRRLVVRISTDAPAPAPVAP